MIPINQPIYDEKEINAVNKVLESGLFTVSAYSLEGGPNVQKFEKGIADFTKTKHCVATGSGTQALEVALMALGIKHGDYVMVPSMTFVATVNAVLRVGGIPIFCDVDADGHINYSDIKTRLQKNNRIKCIIMVDLYGWLPADFQEIKTLGIPIIEDACQALGTYGAGTLGDIACFSFYASKVMTTAGMGGACVTNIEPLKHECQLARNQGIENGDCVVLGGNMLMNEMNAAFGIEQLKKLPNFILRRQSNLAQLGLPNDFNGYMATIVSHKRDKMKKILNDKGIGATVYYDPPIHMFSGYDDYHVKLPNTEKLAKTVLSLPVHPNIPYGAIETMKKVLEDR